MGKRHYCAALIWTAWTAWAHAGEFIPVDVHPGWGIPGPVYILDAPEASAPPGLPASVKVPSGPLDLQDGAMRRPTMNAHAMAAALSLAPPGSQGWPGSERFRVVDQALEDHESTPHVSEPYRGVDRLYVGTSSNIVVYDTSDPAQHELLGKVPGGATDLFAFEGYLYALSDGGTSIYSLADPDLPVLVSHVAGLEGQSGIALAAEPSPDGDQVYARLCSLVSQTLPSFGWTSMVQVLDIEDPANPIFLYYILISGADGVANFGQKAYVAASAGVHVVTLYNEPSYADYQRSQGWSCDVFTPGHVHGDPAAYLYVGIPSGVMVYDLSTANPLLTYVSTWFDPGFEGNLGRGRHMDYQKDSAGERLYVHDATYGSNHHTFSILDAADKDSLAWLGGWQGEIWDDTAPRISGSHAYVPDTYTGKVTTVDVSDPALPTQVGETWVGVDFTGVDITDGAGAVSARDRFYFFDSDPGGVVGPVGLQVMESDSLYSASAKAIDRIGDAVFTRDYNSHLTSWPGACFDVSNPEAVTKTGSYENWTSNWQAAQGNLIYGGKKTLKVIDVSNPAQPDSIGALAWGGTPRSGEVSGSLLAVRISSEVKLIDVSDPTLPVEVGTVGSVSAPYLPAISLDGSLLVVVEKNYPGQYFLAFHDVSDPESPSLISALAWPQDGEIIEVVLEQGRLFVAAAGKVYALDVADPTNLQWLGAYPEFGRSSAGNALSVEGREVQLVGSSGLQMLRFLDVKATLKPKEAPVVVQPGGAFEFEIRLENLSRTAQTTQAWVEAILPDGSAYGPVLGPARLSLGAGESVEFQLSQPVPTIAPAGSYGYRLRVGSYPDEIDDQESFDFTVEPAAIAPPGTSASHAAGRPGAATGTRDQEKVDRGGISAETTRS